MAYKFLDSVGLAYVLDKIKGWLAQKSDIDHTHNYAGSASVGGAATSANKLNTNAGSKGTPVYFENGVPVACTSLNLEVTGVSDSANKDGDGNVITETYATKQDTYTKTQVDTKITDAIADVDLSGYLTTTEASNTYATKTELATALTTAEIDEIMS